METIFRPFRRADMADVAALWHAAWHDGHGGLLPADIVAMRTPETFRLRLEPLAEGAIVAERGGRILGFAAVLGEEIDQIYVARDMRGSGLAAGLLGAAEALLRERGVTTAVMQCTAGNARAHRFYVREGWTDRGIEDLPIWMPDDRVILHPTHVFTKGLTAGII